MGLKKEQAAGYRQEQVLQAVSQPGGSTSGKLAKRFRVPRGAIINDIKDLRTKGYPIQATSMRTEDGIYQAVFELIRTPEPS